MLVLLGLDFPAESVAPVTDTLVLWMILVEDRTDGELRGEG